MDVHGQSGAECLCRKQFRGKKRARAQDVRVKYKLETAMMVREEY